MSEELTKLQQEYVDKHSLKDVAEVLERTALLMFESNEMDVYNLFINLAIIELMGETDNCDYSSLAVTLFLARYNGLWRRRFYRKIDKIHAYMLAAEHARSMHEEKQNVDRREG